MKNYKQFVESIKKSGLSTQTLNSYIDKSGVKSREYIEKGLYDKARKKLDNASKALDITGARMRNQ